MAILQFLISNIGWVLLVVGSLYLIWFIFRLVRSFTHGEGFTYSLKYLLAFVFIVGFAIYCLVTGQDFTQYIH